MVIRRSRTRLCRGTRAFPNVFYVYILESEVTHRWYIGMCTNVEERLKEHNAGRVRSTKGYRPYVVIYTETFPDKTLARKREIQIKKSGLIRKQLKDQLVHKAPSSNG